MFEQQTLTSAGAPTGPRAEPIESKPRHRRHGGAALLATAAACGLVACSEPVDLDTFRTESAAALGGPAATLEFTAAGWDACLGQAWDVREGWARWELTQYRRTIDYDAGISTQSAMRRAGLDPDRVGGCGGQVGAAASAQQSNIAAGADFPARIPLVLTPHGLLALAASPAAALESTADGFELTVPVEGNGVAYRVVADYGPDFLPRRATTWIDDPVFGDMPVVAGFTDYRDFGGVTFPGHLTLNQGGMATLDLTIDSARSGVASPELPAPRAFGGGGGGGAAAGPAFTSIGDGVFVMLGAYQGVAVEFDDFAVVIDGMQNDARTQEIIRLTHEAIPDKPIRYVVNTHSHFDHASGLRQYAAEGATILTHTMNVPFYTAALATPRTLNPARIEPERVDAVIEGIDSRFVIADDTGQRLEIVPLAPSQHAADMLIGWLPNIQTVVESDLLQPWINPVFAGDGPGPHPYLAYLHTELERAGLDYAQFVPIHNPPDPPLMPRSALENAVLPSAGNPTAGHVHLTVPDVAKHRAIWLSLGGTPRSLGPLEVIDFPGVAVLLTEGAPEAASIETTANHVGFSVRDFADYRARLEAAGATFFYEDADAGQILADLPDGVRIEILTDPEQAEPIAFHHFHLSVPDADKLREWYVTAFGAMPGERRGLPSAVVPDGRVDFIPARGDAPRASRGGAIDHIGFEVDDMDAFAARMAALGIEFDRAPQTIDAIGITIAFITDPAGTYIEITQGLDDAAP